MKRRVFLLIMLLVVGVSTTACNFEPKEDIKREFHYRDKIHIYPKDDIHRGSVGLHNNI